METNPAPALLRNRHRCFTRWHVVAQTKEIICFSKWAPSMLLFHLLHIFPLTPSSVHFWKATCVVCQDLGKSMEYSLKQKFQPDGSTRRNYQSKTPLLGITLPTSMRKGEGGKKSNNPKSLHYGDFMGQVSWEPPLWSTHQDKAICKH